MVATRRSSAGLGGTPDRKISVSSLQPLPTAATRRRSAFGPKSRASAPHLTVPDHGGTSRRGSRRLSYVEVKLGFQEGPVALPEPEGVASAASSFINLSNTILGSGVLALPAAFAKGGFVIGTLLLSLSAAGAAFGLYLLSWVCATLGGRKLSFGATATQLIPKAAGIIDIAVAIKCFGVSISYLIVVGDAMPPAAEQIFSIDGDHWAANRRFWIAVLFGTVCVPLAFLRDLNGLRFTSAFALLSVAFLVVVVCVYAFVPSLNPCDVGPILPDGSPCRGAFEAWTGDVSVLGKLSTFVFAFTCHQNIFSINNELRQNTLGRLQRITSSAVATCYCVYLLVAWVGYWAWGENVEGNILNNYPNTEVPITIARLMLAFLVVASYPLQTHPARASIVHLIQLIREDEQVPKAVHYGITICLLALSLTVALIVTQLDLILSIVGATASTTICYILPGIFYVVLDRRERKSFKWTKDWTFLQVAAALMVLIGVFVMVTCLTSLAVW